MREFFVVQDPDRDLDDPDDEISEERSSWPGHCRQSCRPRRDWTPAVNAAPAFVDLTDQTIEAGQELALLLQPVDPDGGIPGMFPGAIPPGARYVDNLDGTRTLLWRPLQPDVGIREFTITAIDAEEPAYRVARTVRIKVILPADLSSIENLPPAVNRVRQHTVRVDDPVVMEIKGTDPNGTAPVLTIENQPAGARFTPHYKDAGVYVLSFVPTSPGMLSFTINATDAIDSRLDATREIVVDVLPAADFERAGERLRTLAVPHGLLLGYASLQGFYTRPDGALYGDIAGEEFDFVTTENDLKWSLVNPLPGKYRWASADNLVRFANVKNMAIHGHTLVWYRQLPGWIRRSAPADREVHMREYIDRVLTRYADDIQVWDVVNEAFEDDGSFRDSIWFEAMGEDYIDIAFRQARESAPETVLLYNDYDIVDGRCQVRGHARAHAAAQDAWNTARWRRPADASVQRIRCLRPRCRGDAGLRRAGSRRVHHRTGCVDGCGSRCDARRPGTGLSADRRGLPSAAALPGPADLGIHRHVFLAQRVHTVAAR